MCSACTKGVRHRGISGELKYRLTAINNDTIKRYSWSDLSKQPRNLWKEINALHTSQNKTMHQQLDRAMIQLVTLT